MDLITTIMLFVIAGACAGLASGLLGAGGGTIVVPFLAIIFLHNGIPMETAMHTAVGTSLAIMIVTTTSSTLAHARNGAIRWDIYRKILIGIVIGAVLGAKMSNALPGALLHKIFIVFIVLSSIQVAFRFLPELKGARLNRKTLSLFGFVSGFFSAGLGVGGSVANVPFFVMNRVRMQQAVATSAVCALPIALIGTTVFILSGIGREGRTPHSFGFINIPAFITVSVVSMVMAHVGAHFAHRMSPKRLRWIFSITLIIVAIGMVVEG